MHATQPSAVTEATCRSRRALLALTTAVFITVLTEALPAGLLPAMSADLASASPRRASP